MDTELMIWTMMVIIQSFTRSGIPDEHGRRLGPTDPRATRRFRGHVHALLDFFTEETGSHR